MTTSSDDRPTGLNAGGSGETDDTLLRSGPADAVDEYGRRDDAGTGEPNPLAATSGAAVQPPPHLMDDGRWGGSDTAYADAFRSGQTPNQGPDGGVYRADGSGDFDRRGDLADRDAGRP